MSYELTPDDLATMMPVSPATTEAGELHSPARQQVPSVGTSIMSPAATGPITYGIDLFENNQWYHDAKVQFMIHKAFEPGYGQDSKFASRWALAKSMGLLRGAYVFGHPSSPAASTASKFVQILRNNGITKNDRVFLDHEVTDGKSPSYCSGWAEDVCAGTNSALGFPACGVYTYQQFIAQGNCAGLGQYPLWLARYFAPISPMPAVSVPNSPWASCVLDQYGVFAIDWDYAAMSYADLQTWWTKNAAVASVPPKNQTGWWESYTNKGARANISSSDGGHTWMSQYTAPGKPTWQVGELHSNETGGRAYAASGDGGVTIHNCGSF